MLEAKNICFGYTKDNVLKSISVNFEKGNLYTIAGANGCGKTTLLKAFARLIKPSGELLLDKKGYDKYERYEFAKKVAYLPQVRSTPSLTVGQLVAHGRFPYLGFSRVMSAEDKAATEKALLITGLENMKDKNVKNLSGGERQRAYIAMTLAQDADYIFMDEPTTYLDICHKFEIMELISKISKDGKAVVSVLHDLSLACRYSNKILLMSDGRIYDEGEPIEIVKKGSLDHVFGVTSDIIEKDGRTEYIFTPRK